MFVWSMSVTTGSTVTVLLIARSFRAAASALGRLSATSCSSKRIWRWRLWVSMKSRSTIRTRPTPARTRWFASTVPSAPQPQIVTRLSRSFSGPPRRAREPDLPAVAVERVGWVEGHDDFPGSPSGDSVSNLSNQSIRGLPCGGGLGQEWKRSPRNRGSRAGASLRFSVPHIATPLGQEDPWFLCPGGRGPTARNSAFPRGSGVACRTLPPRVWSLRSEAPIP